MNLREHLKHFLHNKELKHKLYIIIFESDTPAGKLFDVALIICITLSILLAILESLQGLPSYLTLPFIILEYLFTAFFTFEYVTRIYCSPQPKKYIFSFFGIIDLLATLPLYLAFFLPGARYLLVIRAFRIIRVFRIFKLFTFWMEGERLLTSLKESSKKIAVFFLFVVILVVSIGTLMGYCHHDNSRLWRYYTRNGFREIPLCLCNANGLYHYSSAHRHRIRIDDERI